MTSEETSNSKSAFPKDVILFRTCQLLVKFFRNLEEEGRGAHTRIFNYILHPEKDYVYHGTSVAAKDLPNPYPEHAVPCAILRNECHRLIRERKLGDDEIANLLMKHWKIVGITKEEQGIIDSIHKSDMPEGWSFETGDTFARFNHKDVNIEIVPKVFET